MTPLRDDDTDKEESFQETMNAKSSNGVVSGIIAGAVVALVQVVLSNFSNHTTTTDTVITGLQVQVATLTTQVTTLSSQVGKLTEQPYVRRDELEDRISGLDQRLNQLERAQQQRR